MPLVLLLQLMPFQRRVSTPISDLLDHIISHCMQKVYRPTILLDFPISKSPCRNQIHFWSERLVKSPLVHRPLITSSPYVFGLLSTADMVSCLSSHTHCSYLPNFQVSLPTSNLCHNITIPPPPPKPTYNPRAAWSGEARRWPFHARCMPWVLPQYNPMQQQGRAHFI
eukprot:EG_transcript_37851